MSLLTQGKTNWKYILIVMILALIVSGGILGYLRYFKKEIILISQLPEIKKPEKIAEEERTTEKKIKTYQSSDGFLIAKVIPGKKNQLGNAWESIVEIWTNDGKLLQKKNYTSEDGDHGLVIAQAAWTPDSQFFIYSAYSSGGHQPWFSRVHVYSRSCDKIYNFKEVSGFTVARDEFTMATPDIVTFTVYTSPGMGPTATKSFKLSDVINTLNWKVYRNEKYGFKIKYPKNWKLWITQPDEFSPHGDWGKQIGELAIFQNRVAGTPYCEFHLTIYSNPKNLSIRDFWRARLPEVYKFKSSENIIFGENQISGVKFSMERTDQPLPNESTAVITKKDGNIIELFWWGQDPTISNPECLKSDQMLSTFRFLE